MSASEQNGLSATTPPKRPAKRVSLQTVERLSVYRKVLEELDRDGVENIHSHAARRAGRRHAGPAPPRPRQLRHLRQHLPRLQRVPDEPHHQPHPRHRRDPVASPSSASATWAARSSPTGASRSAASTSPWRSTSTARRSAASSPAGAATTSTTWRRCCASSTSAWPILASRPEGLQALVDRVVRRRRARDPQLRAQARRAPPAGCFVEETDIASKLEMLSFLARSEAESPCRRTRRVSRRGGDDGVRPATRRRGSVFFSRLL